MTAYACAAAITKPPQALRRSPETDHLCSGEVDQARNTDRDRDVLRMTAG